MFDLQALCNGSGGGPSTLRCQFTLFSMEVDSGHCLGDFLSPSTKIMLIISSERIYHEP